MGKVKTINPEEQELKAKEKAQKEAERLARIEEAKALGQAKKGKPVTVNREEEPATTENTENSTEAQKTEEVSVASEKSKKKSKYAEKVQAKKGSGRSEKYQTASKLIDKSQLYSLKEALALVEKAHLASFDETVELHINTTSSGISGQVTLPHGTGKQVRVAILAPSKDAAKADALLKDIESGKIDFDVLVATPDAMPKLAKVARILGPRGLMPNPKSGTVTPKPEEVASRYAGGQINFKTEAKAPVMHLSVGKLSFGAEKLAENITTALKAVKMENIKKVTLKSTMSPAIKLLVK